MEKTLFIQTDGGARGNPGPAAIGVYIKDETGKEIAKFGRKIGRATNNVAEYQAVIAALGWLKKKEMGKGQRIKFFLDSNLVVNQLNGLFKVKESHLKELMMEVRKLEQEVGGNVSYQFLSREQNIVPDTLVNRSLDGFIN